MKMLEKEILLEDPDKLEEKLREDLQRLRHNRKTLEGYYEEFKKGDLPENLGVTIFLIMASYTYVRSLRSRLDAKKNDFILRDKVWIKGGNPALNAIY